MLNLKIHYCLLLLLLPILSMFGWAKAVAGDEPVKQPLSVEQIIIEAKKLESVDIKRAIALMLRREKAVVNRVGAVDQATFYNKLSELHATLGQLRMQKTFAAKGLKLIGQELVPIAADLHYNLGLAYEMKADFAQAKVLYKKGLVIAEQTGSLVFQSRGKLFLASIFANEGNYEAALKSIKDAYQLAEQVQDDNLNWEVHNGMSILYDQLGDGPLSLEFSLKAYQSSQKLDIGALNVVALYNIAFTYLQLKQYDNASIYFEEMLEISKATGEPADMHSAYQGFARVAAGSGQHERALSYIEKAEQYLTHVGSVLDRVKFHLVKADILHQLEQSNRAIDELVVAQQLLPTAQRYQGSKLGLQILHDRAIYHGELGQSERAYELLKQYSEGIAVYQRNENLNAVRRLRVSFDFERNENHNVMLQKQNEIKALQLEQANNEGSIQIVLLIALAILSLGLLLAIYRQHLARRTLTMITQTDELTGLGNRSYGFAKAQSLLEQANQNGTSLAVVKFDMDNFKSINDNYGHSAGDQVLRNVATLCQSCLRDSDVLARIGGKAFVAFLPGVQEQVAQIVANRIKDKLSAEPQHFEQNKFLISACFGVVISQADDSFDTLMAKAQDALSLAQTQGRNYMVLGADHATKSNHDKDKNRAVKTDE